jgi:hypothetical protein
MVGCRESSAMRLRAGRSFGTQPHRPETGLTQGRRRTWSWVSRGARRILRGDGRARPPADSRHFGGKTSGGSALAVDREFAEPRLPTLSESDRDCARRSDLLSFAARPSGRKTAGVQHELSRRQCWNLLVREPRTIGHVFELVLGCF